MTAFLIKAVIFDLDNCLYDTRSLGESIIVPIIESLQSCSIKDYCWDAICKDMWQYSFEDLVIRHNLPGVMAEAGRRAYRQLQVTPPLAPYPDLEALEKIELVKILVTSGYRNFQNSKIKALGITDHFQEIIIDANDDPANRKGKQQIFSEFLSRHSFPADAVVVIGDNCDSEIKAGNNIGMITVQILRPGIARGDIADYYVNDLWQFLKLLTDIQTSRSTR